MTVVIRCDQCSYVDTNPERFALHSPCTPEASTVWVSYGSGGVRVDNDLDAIRLAVDKFMTAYSTISSVSLHHGRCALGLTSNKGCTCYPTTVLRRGMAQRLTRLI